jgi:hypothetical protein
MKFTLSIITSLALQFCFAQIDYQTITDTTEVSRLKKEFNTSLDIYCEKCDIVINNTEEFFRLRCKEKSEGGMLLFGTFDSDSDSLSREANNEFIRAVIKTEFKGNVDLKLFSFYSNDDKALLFLEFPADKSSTLVSRTYLYERD